MVAATRGERRRGLRPLPGPEGLMLLSRSIHTFGVRGEIAWIAFDRDGLVIRGGVLAPRRLVFLRSKACILEQPGDLQLPEVGELASLDRLFPWPERSSSVPGR